MCGMVAAANWSRGRLVVAGRLAQFYFPKKLVSYRMEFLMNSIGKICPQKMSSLFLLSSSDSRYLLLAINLMSSLRRASITPDN
jgi:hypothetical protein